MLGRAKKSIDDSRQVAETLPGTEPQRLLFISHANPEDNVFAKWMATQLAVAGYEVWCDVTELLGGECFWDDIDEAIDTHAFRLLFVSSRNSNRKPGTLRELKLAQDAQDRHGLKDFIVPLKLDDLPFDSAHESLHGINFVRFDDGWAAGLSQLLSLLEREGAPKSPAAGPACVSEWYRRSMDSRRQILVSNEKCFTNWFELRLPNYLRFHQYTGSQDRLAQMASALSWPARAHGDHLVTFAGTRQLCEQLGGSSAFPEVLEVQTESFVQDGDDSLAIAAFDAAKIVSDLVRQGWESTMSARGLGVHRLASGLPAWFFKQGQLPKDKAHFQVSGRKKAYRQLVGRKSKRLPDGTRKPDGHWHYAVSAAPQLWPFPRMILRHHVIFTDDGETPWASAPRMHKARRSVCKNWWNHQWRDRLFAFCSAVAEGGTELALPMGDEEVARLTMTPMTFTSPWTYLEDNQSGIDEAGEVELIEDPEEDGDDNETDV